MGMPCRRSGTSFGSRKTTAPVSPLKVDAGDHGPAWTDAPAAEAFDVHVNIVDTIRKQRVLH